MNRVRYKGCAFVCFVIIGLYLVISCAGSSTSGNLPYGNYKSTYFPSVNLNEDGTFYIEHEGNAEDPKYYTISGTFTHTVEVVDPDNDTYGKIDLVCSTLTQNGSSVSQIVGTFCDDSASCSGPILYSGNTLLGWWAYSNNITWGGKLRIWLNYPPDLRAGSPYSGSRSLIRVDPV